MVRPRRPLCRAPRQESGLPVIERRPEHAYLAQGCNNTGAPLPGCVGRDAGRGGRLAAVAPHGREEQGGGVPPRLAQRKQEGLGRILHGRSKSACQRFRIMKKHAHPLVLVSLHQTPNNCTRRNGFESSSAYS